MAVHCCAGASLRCSFGAAPAILGVLPEKRVNAGGPPAANIVDNKPMVNVPSFGMCSSAANPAVASATAAALGVLTPMPCIPVVPAPWVLGSPTVLTGPMPALNNNCRLMCAWGGLIEVLSPGQTTVMVP